MRIWLIAVMVILALIVVDITVRIGWDRFSSGIGSLVDGQRHAERLPKQPADIKNTSTDKRQTAKQPTQSLPGAVSSPGETISYQGNLGYKDFSWGDSILKVKSKVSDLKSSAFGVLDDAVLGAYFVQYGHLYEGLIPHPLSTIAGKIETFYSEVSKTAFAFLEGKLMAVAVEFHEESALPSLEKKYGTAKYGTAPSHFLGTAQGTRYIIRAWFEDKDRVIIYSRMMGSDLELVTYLDGKVYNKAAAELVQKRKTESEDSLKRID